MVTVLCAGAHGSDIAVDVNAVRLYDDDVSLGHQPLWAFRGGPAYVGVNDSGQRKAIAEKWGAKNPDGWVHRSAVFDRSALGEHTHVNAGCTVIRARLGAFCTLSPGVTVCGDVIIGDHVTIGAGATICNLVTIGDGATIGAGAVITPGSRVAAGETWVGVPGRPL